MRLQHVFPSFLRCGFCTTRWLSSTSHASLASADAQALPAFVNEFRSLLAQNGSASALKQPFRSIVQRRRSLKSSYNLAERELATALARFSQSSNRQDRALALEIFDSFDAFGVQRKQLHYCHALAAAAIVTSPRKALEIIARSPRRMSKQFLFNVLLDEYRALRIISAMRFMLKSPEHSVWVVEKENSYAKLLSAMLSDLEISDAFVAEPPVREVDGILQEMRQQGIVPARMTQAVLQRARVERWGPVARQLLDSDLEGLPSRPATVWLEDISAYNTAGLVDKMWETVAGMRADGYELGGRVLLAVLREERSAADLMATRQRLGGVEANVIHWGFVVNNASRMSGAYVAVVVYNAARSAGILPTAGLVYPILKALLRRKASPPTARAIDLAIKIYRDLRDNADVTHEISARATGPDQSTYRTLMNALSNTLVHPNIRDLIRELLQDMQTFNVSLDMSPVTSSVLASVTGATSHADALNAFRLAKDTSPEALQSKDYIKALQLIAYSTYPNSLFIPPSIFFEFVRDMVWSGHRLTAHPYLIVLHRYHILGIQSQNRKPGSKEEEDALKEQLILRQSALATLHEGLLMDTSVTLSAALLNALMNAYKANAMYDDALVVWNWMVEQGIWQSKSVSIAFDVCGFGQRREAASSIFE